MKELIQENRVFLVPFIILWLVGFGVTLFLDKVELHCKLNQLHAPFWDVFFRYSTNLGDGITFIIVALSGFLYCYRLTIYLGSIGTITLLLVLFLKKVVFYKFYRPFQVYQELDIPLRLVQGEQMLSTNSFPSGHTTTAFALFFTLCMFSKNRFLKILFFFLALIVAYSRIYLSQHFLMDVVAGSFLGIFIAIFVSLILNNNLIVGQAKKNKTCIPGYL
ncbi:Phosphatidic acid phosphatase type 2/haloperoxidase [Candidatus Magnetomorum sp. HK-1]|nr:Phosphatidic acid phosphatase type 2/haloperoxidase [Candidatus Magnetomorum sp. HK-1]